MEGEFVVQQAEGLKGGEGFIALGGALAGISAVERGHERVGLVNNEPVQAVFLEVGGIVVVFVVRQVVFSSTNK